MEDEDDSARCSETVCGETEKSCGHDHTATNDDSESVVDEAPDTTEKTDKRGPTPRLTWTQKIPQKITLVATSPP